MCTWRSCPQRRADGGLLRTTGAGCGRWWRTTGRSNAPSSCGFPAGSWYHATATATFSCTKADSTSRTTSMRRWGWTREALETNCGTACVLSCSLLHRIGHWSTTDFHNCGTACVPSCSLLHRIRHWSTTDFHNCGTACVPSCSLLHRIRHWSTTDFHNCGTACVLSGL